MTSIFEICWTIDLASASNGILHCKQPENPLEIHSNSGCWAKIYVCFYNESHWIWFAIHLNRFDHISSLLGIVKSTRAENSFSFTHSLLEMTLFYWCCKWSNSNAMQIRDIALSSWKWPRASNGEFHECKVKCAISCHGKNGWERYKIFFSSPSLSMHWVHAPGLWHHIELVQNLIYYFPIVFTSWSIGNACRLRHKVTTCAPMSNAWTFLCAAVSLPIDFRYWYWLT